MAELTHTFTVREIGEIRREDEDTFNGVVLDGSKEAIRSIAPLFGEKVILAPLSTQEATMAEPRKQFPILGSGGAKIDWQLVADHGEQARKNHYQSVERLADRGGLAWSELYAVLHNKPWEQIDTNEAIIACRALETSYLSALSPSPAPDMREAVEALLAVVAAIRAYLPPDGITAAECIDRVLAATDNAKINPIIHRAENGHGHS